MNYSKEELNSEWKFPEKIDKNFLFVPEKKE
jgi:hypothetical protein